MKTSLLLIAILGGFGIVGRMDYDDAVAFEAAKCKSSYCPEITHTASAEE